MYNHSRSKLRSARSSHLILRSLEKAEEDAISGRGRGELLYYERIDSTVYKLVFSLLPISTMKLVRLVCKKWHQEIFPLFENKTVFVFEGLDNPTDLNKARQLSAFLKVVPRNGFTWKMLKALYPKPEEAIPIPVLIQWSHLLLIKSNYPELRQWISRTHTPNVSHLELLNVRLNWSKYLLIFRELETLSSLTDTSICISSGIWEEFEKGLGFNEKLFKSEYFLSLQDSGNFSQENSLIPPQPQEDLKFLFSKKIKKLIIRRGRLEEIIIFLKMFLLMDLSALERLEITAEDLYKGCAKNFLGVKRKSTIRLQEVKTTLFGHLGALIKRNRDTLVELEVGFTPLGGSEWFGQYVKDKYEDMEVNLYKPDLRDFIVYMKHHRWQSELKCGKLTRVKMAFENRRIPTVEEIESFANFINAQKFLKILDVSHFFLTSYNSLSIPLLLKKILDTQYYDEDKIDIKLGISLRNNDTEGLSLSTNSTTTNHQDDYHSNSRSQLPTNLELFYPNLKSIIVTCHSKENEGDVAYSLFRQDPSNPSNPVDKSGVEDFWVIDERPEGSRESRIGGRSTRTVALFSITDITESYPYLRSLIIKDCGNKLRTSANDLSRWNLVDDFGMQLILKGLGKLRHLELSGNLFYLTDSGITGFGYERCERMRNSGVDLDMDQDTVDFDKGYDFSSLKELEYLSLQYLGSKFTDVALRYGFNGMEKLGFLYISGLIQVSDSAIKSLKNQYTKNTTVVDRSGSDGSNCGVVVNRLNV